MDTDTSAHQDQVQHSCRGVSYKVADSFSSAPCLNASGHVPIHVVAATKAQLSVYCTFFDQEENGQIGERRQSRNGLAAQYPGTYPTAISTNFGLIESFPSEYDPV
jgi:hypothetical protein